MNHNDALHLQYEKLVDLGLHYDQKLWLIPSAAYSILVVSYYGIFSTELPVQFRPYFAGLALLAFLGFLIQLIKDRTLQLGNQAAIDEVKKQLQMVSTSEFVGVQPRDSKDRWFIRATRGFSAVITVVYIMMATALFQVGIVASLVLAG